MSRERTSIVCGVARGDERAFTLLDLMVVIATLAILAALLLPALARSDDNGARMVCLNNLRQMGMASNMYVADNRDYFPYPNWDGGSDPAAPQGWLYSMRAGDLPAGALPGTIPNPRDPGFFFNKFVLASQTGLYYKYLANPDVYLCPVDIASPTFLTKTGVAVGNTVGRNNKLSSYVMNGAVVGYATYGMPCKITDAWSPSCYLLWEPDENAAGQGNPGGFDYNDGANMASTGEGVGRLHSANSGDLLCVGGNVQLLTTQDFKNQTSGRGAGPGGKTLAQWNPFPIRGH